MKKKPDAVEMLTQDPLSATELRQFDKVRLLPLIETLTGQLVKYLQQGRRYSTSKKSTSSQAMVVALHSALGDGKTTILEAVWRRLDGRPSSREINLELIQDWLGCSDEKNSDPPVEPKPEKQTRGVLGLTRWPRLLKIDVSRFFPNSIEGYLWTVLLLHSLYFWVLVVCAIYLSLVISIQLPILQDTNLARINFVSVILIAATLIIPALNLAALAAKTWLNIEPLWLDKLIHSALWWLPFWPDVLFIDDFDRCKVETQRSLLWALHYRAKVLGMAVVIAFDESDLLASEPAPESPEELLRKLVLVTYRIPPRTAEDAAYLAFTQCHRLAAINTEVKWLNVTLQDSALPSGLAQLCTTLGHINPRRVQNLLQDAVIATLSGPFFSMKEKAGCDLTPGSDVLRAHMLLICLQQEAPALCRDGMDLASVLQDPSPERLDAWLAPVGEKSSRRKKLAALLHLGPSFTPHPFNWHDFMTHVPLKDNNNTKNNLSTKNYIDAFAMADKWQLFLNWRAVINSIVDEHGDAFVALPDDLRKELSSNIKNKSHEESQTSKNTISDYEMTCGWTLVCAMWPLWNAHQKLQFCEWWQDKIIPHLENASNSKYWRVECWRLWLTDPTVLALMPLVKIKPRFQQAGADGCLWIFLAALPTIPEQAHTALWDALLISLGTPEGIYGYEKQLRQAIKGRWPKNLERRKIDTTGRMQSDPLRKIWPLQTSNLNNDIYAKEVAANIQAYSLVISKTQLEKFPSSLQAVMESSRSAVMSLVEWVDALTPLLRTGNQCHIPRGEFNLPSCFFDENSWQNSTIKEICSEKTRWLAAFCLLLSFFSAIKPHTTSVASERILFLQGVLRKITIYGRRMNKTLVLPLELLGDGLIEAQLVWSKRETTKNRRNQIAGWMHITILQPLLQKPPQPIDEINRRIGQWIRFIPRLADTKEKLNDPAHDLIRRYAIPKIWQFDGVSLKNLVELHRIYEWPVISQQIDISDGHVVLQKEAALRWLETARVHFNSIDLISLRELVLHALDVWEVKLDNGGIDQLFRDDLLKRFDSREYQRLLIALEKIKQNWLNTPSTPDTLPAAEPGAVQVWLARWRPLIPADLPEDADEANERLQGRIKIWGERLLATNNSAYEQFEADVYAIVLEARCSVEEHLA